MGLEAGTYIDSLNSAWPLGAIDPKSQGDDHFRLIKSTIQNTFPNLTGAMTATHTELNLMDGVTSTTAELNILDGVTSTAAELNILDGVTSTTAELNILDGVTSTAAELNYLDITAAGTAQLSKALVLDGSKNITGITNLTAALLTGTAVNILSDFQLNGATVNSTAIELNALFGAGVSATEMSYINSLSSNAQTQLNTITANNWVTTARVTDLNITGAKIAADTIAESKIDYSSAGGMNQTVIQNGELTHVNLTSFYADIETDATFFSLYIPTNANSVEFRFESHVTSGGALSVRLDLDGGTTGISGGISGTSYTEDTGTVDVSAMSGWVDGIAQWKKAGTVEDVFMRRFSVRII